MDELLDRVAEIFVAPHLDQLSCDLVKRLLSNIIDQRCRRPATGDSGYVRE